jgi:hypothetical protein
MALKSYEYNRDRELQTALHILKKIRDCCERSTGERRFVITNPVGFQEAMLVAEELLQVHKEIP